MAPDRRQALLAAKLRVLVAGAFGVGAGAGERRPEGFAGGAALVEDPGEGEQTAWILADTDPARSLGPALAWALRRGITNLHLVVDEGGGTLARRAAAFRPAPTVWVVEGRALGEARPGPIPTHPPLPPEVVAYTPVLEAAGCDVTVEHGRLIGEVLGLEVARVWSEGGVARLEVGVGRFDREAHAAIDDHGQGGGALAGVVDLVREHRRPGARRHPLNQLVPERLLRRLIVDDPGLVGAGRLRPVAPLSPLPDLRSSGPVPAVGVDTEGRPLVVVCSVGVDPDLVPSAADARSADGQGARLVLAVPERDAVGLTRELAAALIDPAEVVAVDLPARS